MESEEEEKTRGVPAVASTHHQCPLGGWASSQDIPAQISYVNHKVIILVSFGFILVRFAST